MSHPTIAYTPAEAADALRVSRQQIYRLIEQGKLRRFNIGRSARIPAADVHFLVGYLPEGGANDAA